jgi:hypothetical protein
MPAVLHELHQCITEVVIQGPIYAAVNLTTSRLLMGHLQDNQGSTHQTPVDKMKYFLTLCKWFHVIMAFRVLVTLVSDSYDFLLFSSFQALLLGVGLCFQYNLPPFLTDSLWPLSTCFLYPLYLNPLQPHLSNFM